MRFLKCLPEGILLILLTFIIGCAKAPNQKVADVKDAIEWAKAQGADYLAKSDFESANRTFEIAMTSIGAENKKLTFLRSYEKASRLLNDAEKVAEKAAQSAQIEQQRIQPEMELAELKGVQKNTMKPTRKKTSRK
jgi:hypothetical protein